MSIQGSYSLIFRVCTLDEYKDFSNKSVEFLSNKNLLKIKIDQLELNKGNNTIIGKVIIIEKSSKQILRIYPFYHNIIVK